jgi:hypothetical protein
MSSLFFLFKPQEKSTFSFFQKNSPLPGQQRLYTSELTPPRLEEFTHTRVCTKFPSPISLPILCGWAIGPSPRVRCFDKHLDASLSSVIKQGGMEREKHRRERTIETPVCKISIVSSLKGCFINPPTVQIRPRKSFVNTHLRKDRTFSELWGSEGPGRFSRHCFVQAPSFGRRAKTQLPASTTAVDLYYSDRFIVHLLWIRPEICIKATDRNQCTFQHYFPGPELGHLAYSPWAEYKTTELSTLVDGVEGKTVGGITVGKKLTFCWDIYKNQNRLSWKCEELNFSFLTCICCITEMDQSMQFVGSTVNVNVYCTSKGVSLQMLGSR